MSGARNPPRGGIERPAPIATGAAALLVLLGAVLSLAVLLRVQIETGFALVTGDIYDGRIAISLEQHWFNVLRGIEHWNRPGYFYPHGDTLGYNDGYLLFGLAFSLFRAFGIDPILCSELVNICIRLIGYAAFIAVAVDLLLLPLVWAVLGAVLFTISGAMYLQEVHQQLLAISFAPLLAWLCWKSWSGMTATPGRAALYGSAGMMLLGAWLLTGFYMAWFTVFFAVILLGACLLQPGAWKGVWPTLARLLHWPAGVAVIVLIAAVLPFLWVYGQTAVETGQHAFGETLVLMPSPADILHVGPKSLLYGWLDRAFTRWTDPGTSELGEHIVGFPPLLLLLAGFGLVLAWLPGHRVPSGRRIAWRSISMAIVLALLLCLRSRDYGLWHLVFLAFPGAAAIRAETRLLLFLDLPVVMLAMLAMAERARRWPRPVMAALASLLIAGEINLATAQQLDRPAETAVTDRVPAAPANCGAFYISARGDQQRAGSPQIDAIYHHNVDAMMLSALHALPTLNGYATFIPTDIQAINRLPVLPAAMRAYLRAHGVHGTMCGLDLETDRWTVGLEGPAPLPADGVIQMTGQGFDPAPFLGEGWSYREPGARWTDGPSASVEAALPARLAGRALTLTVDATPYSPKALGASPVWVQANGKTVAHWLPQPGQGRFTATIPAEILGDASAVEITLQIERPVTPLSLGDGLDQRMLGMDVHAISLGAAPPDSALR